MSRSDEKRQQKGSKQRSANSGGKGSGAAEAKPTEESKKTLLEYQPWYHGLCLRSDCEELLRKEGDFLVRATDDKGQYNIVISVAGKTRVHHFKLIQSEKGKWKLDAEGFDTTYDLVKNYWRSGRPLVGGKDLFLKRPIKRPKWMVSWFNIEEGKRIGEGAYGEVLLGILKDPDTHSETKVAIKRCKEVRYANEEDRRAFLTEAKLMLELKHENVLSLLGIGADRPPVRLIMEFCPGGSLDKYLKKRKETITLSRQAGLCLESARGMKYLADKQIVHRDLAARNCLLGLRDEVKIADFGMSVKAKQPGKGPGKIAVRWAAPEAMLHAEWTTKSDVYSFGILMWEIYSFADLPWGEKMDNFMVKDAVLEGRVLPQPKAAPNPFYQVMKRCCALDKTQRPDFQHIITELSGFSYVSSVTHGTADDTQGVGKRIEEGVGTTQSAQVSDSASPPSIPATLTRLEQNPQQSEEERDCQVDLQEQQQGCSNSSSLRDGGVSPPAAKRSRSSNFPHHTPNNPHTWHFSHHTEPIYPTSAYLPLAEKSLGSEITDAEPLPQAAMFASDTPLNDSYPDVHSATKSIFQAGTSPLSAQYYGSAVYNGQSLPYGMQGAAGLYAGQSAAAVQQSYYAATRGLKGSPSLPPSYALNPYFPAASATPGTAGYYGGYGGQALDYGYAAAYPSTAQYYGTTGGATLPPSGYGSGYGGPAVTTTTTYQLAQLPPCTSLSGAVTEPNVQYSINDLSPFAKTEPKKAKSKKKKVANPSPTPDGEYERVFIWELEDVALICHSLLDGNYASKFGKSVSERDDLARLGALMQAMVRALTENHFIVNDLEDCDQVHIEDVGMDETGQEIAGYNFSAEGFQLGPAGTPLCLGPTAAGMRGGVDWMRKLACRYRRVRDMYSLYRDNPPALEGLLGPTVEGKQLREVRAELDRLCDSWHALAFKCLAIVSQRPRHANVVVSSGQLVHSAAMVLTYGLGPVFPIENIYSATKIGREACYERVMSRFGKKCTYVVVGAGEEEHSAKQLQVPFWRVSTHSDLAALHHAFEGGYL